jgi:hypothetical protein
LLSFAFGEVMMIAHRSEVMRLHTYFDQTFNVLSFFSQDVYDSFHEQADL